MSPEPAPPEPQGVRRSLEEPPEEPQGQGSAAFLAGDYEVAAELFRSLLAGLAQPERGLCLQLGEALARAGRLPEAIAARPAGLSALRAAALQAGDVVQRAHGVQALRGAGAGAGAGPARERDAERAAGEVLPCRVSPAQAGVPGAGAASPAAARGRAAQVPAGPGHGPG